MKKVTKIKLSDLSQANLSEKELSNVVGGAYCHWGEANKSANAGSGVCSCGCIGVDYYGSSGLSMTASFYKANY